MNDKNLIYWIGGGVLVCGFLILFNDTLGRVMLNFLFLFYLLVRSFYYRKIWKQPFRSIDKQRFAVLIVISLVVLLNFMGMSETYFLPIFLVALEYLMVINRDKQEQNIGE